MSTALIPKNYALQRASFIVPYITQDEMKAILRAIDGRKARRDRLLLKTLFQTGLRVSEAISLKLKMFDTYQKVVVIHIIGKGRKPRQVACPEGLANQIKAYAYDERIGPDELIFPINRQRAWQIVKAAAKRAGIKKDVWPHLFRHSDAIERLRQTGNPKALQIHLGHNTMAMTMRYLSTLTAEDAAAIQGTVVFDDM